MNIELAEENGISVPFRINEGKLFYSKVVNTYLPSDKKYLLWPNENKIVLISMEIVTKYCLMILKLQAYNNNIQHYIQHYICCSILITHTIDNVKFMNAKHVNSKIGLYIWVLFTLQTLIWCNLNSHASMGEYCSSWVRMGAYVSGPNEDHSILKFRSGTNFHLHISQSISLTNILSNIVMTNFFSPSEYV